MEFKLTTIDPYNCSIEELEEEIQKLNNLKEEYHGLEQSLKVFINSVYGATGSAYFECYNVNVAEAVTLQGQDVAKYASRAIDEYFFEFWHKDKKLHEALGITHANKITEKTLTIYMDTDSCYVTFDPVLKSCDYKESKVDFILKIKELRFCCLFCKYFDSK